MDYDGLSDFYWVWESMILTTQATAASVVPHCAASEAYGRAGPVNAELQRAFGEIHRVLKAGHSFCMLLRAATQDGFEAYVVAAERAGFELVGLRQCQGDWTTSRLGESRIRARSTFLVHFRRPALSGPRLKADAMVVLASASANQPVLYEALAKLLLDEVDAPDLHELMEATCPGARGTDLERLMETIADSRDPSELIDHYLGKKTLRRVAEGLGMPASADVPVSPREFVLRAFGFALPSPGGLPGPAQTRQRLEMMLSRIRAARDIPEMRGAFLEASTACEAQIRTAVWGWAQLAFGSERDGMLRGVLADATNRKAKSIDLGRLTFGQVRMLFRDLPGTIVSSSARGRLEQKLGRQMPYSAHDSADRLNELVAARNRLEHVQEHYGAQPSASAIRKDTTAALEEALLLITDLEREGALPRVGVASEETRDLWGKVRYRLELDNGDVVELYSSTPLQLGAGYLYYGGATNPRPVDPMLVPISALGGPL